VRGDPWSDFLPQETGFEADWTDPAAGCGHWDTASKSCGAAPGA
jgi:urea transport system substrate-binding protein